MLNNSKKIFGFMPLYELKESKDGFKKYILGIPYSSSQKTGNGIVKRTFFQMFKKEKSYSGTKYFFLGIKIWDKKRPQIDIITDKISDIQRQMHNMKNNMQQQVHNVENTLLTELGRVDNNVNEKFNSLLPDYNYYFSNETETTDDTATEKDRYIKPIKTTTCRICGGKSKLLFRSKIFHNKYDAEYYHCPNCGFLQAENLEWLNEAYNTPVTEEDTGVLYRNVEWRKYISIILFNLLNPNGKFLDYGGGYGLLTRLLRDIGFEFYHYDKYCENIVAQGFEGNLNDKYDAITTIETFEHFADPLHEIEHMLELSDTIIFTEEILPQPIPEPEEWWYYCLNHGQHISFYSNKTLKYIADKFGLYYFNVYNLHILSKQNFETKINYLKNKNINSLFKEVETSMQSLIGKDMYYIIEKTNK